VVGRGAVIKDEHACNADHNSAAFDDLVEYALHLHVEHGVCASVGEWLGRTLYCYLEAGHSDEHIRSKSGFDPALAWR
jgi:hypothetical protein